jgi:hypothetical protein
MGSWAFAVAFVAAGMLCLRFRAGLRLAGLMTGCLVVAFFTYLLGAVEVAFADPSRFCEPATSIPELDSFKGGFAPLRATCIWNGGRTYELVSPWINPLLYGSLLLAAACLLTLATLRVRKARDS